MTKMMIIPSDFDILTYDAESYLYGYQNLSVNFPITITLEQIQKILPIIKNNQRELFIALNKNFNNEDIKEVKKVLLELDTLGLNGILYYDVAIVNLKEELQLKTPLVWGAEHLTTNYETMNYWYSFGAKYTLVSGEITLSEILEIKKNTQSKMIVPIFGYLPMFVSKRHEIKNYLNYFHLQDNSKIYFIEKEGKKYPILDNEEGTVVYSAHILNGYSEYLKLKGHNIDYVLLNSIFLSKENFQKILILFHQEELKNEEKIDVLCKHNTDKGFLYKETVYQVKKHEK